MSYNRESKQISVRSTLFCFLVLLSFTGCIKDQSESLCQYDPCAVKAPEAEIAAVQKYLTDNEITATQHCSGLFYTIANAGTGSSPGLCSYISVRYKGMLTNGTVFDEQTSPFLFQLGELITGWKNGLMLLKPSGKMRLYVPPSLGYGSRDITSREGVVIIPANSVLVFDIELVTVQ